MSLGDFLDPTLKRKAGVGAGAYRPPGGGGSGRYSSSSRGGGSSFGGASFGEDAAPLPTGPRDRSGYVRVGAGHALVCGCVGACAVCAVC